MDLIVSSKEENNECSWNCKNGNALTINTMGNRSGFLLSFYDFPCLIQLVVKISLPSILQMIGPFILHSSLVLPTCLHYRVQMGLLLTSTLHLDMTTKWLYTTLHRQELGLTESDEFEPLVSQVC